MAGGRVSPRRGRARCGCTSAVNAIGRTRGLCPRARAAAGLRTGALPCGHHHARRRRSGGGAARVRGGVRRRARVSRRPGRGGKRGRRGARYGGRHRVVRGRPRRRPASVALWRTLGHVHLARRDGAAAAAAFRPGARARADRQRHALQPRRRAADATGAPGGRARLPARARVPAGSQRRRFQSRRRVSGGATPTMRRSSRTKRRPGGSAHVAAYKNLGEVLVAAGRIEEWFANFRRFETNCPDALALAVQALEACQYAGRLREARSLPGRAGLERYRPGDEIELARQPGTAPVPVALLRRRAASRPPLRADLRCDRRSTFTARRCRGGGRAGPGGSASATCRPTCATT